MLTFKSSKNIKPTILCYTPNQLSYCQSIIEYDNIPKVMIDNIMGISQNYSQFYLKYLEETQLFANVTNCTFYISDCGLNLLPDHSGLRVPDYIQESSMKRLNQFNIINLYVEKIIGKDFYNSNGS